ncbi:SH3 domain-containing protein [Gracilimonas mengyeensis]|nr:SH3 domain-containing protein [Gracilimonas mengyeensis]
MKKKSLTLTLLILFLATAGQLFARQAPQAMFDEANNLLEEGELNAAMAQYRSIVESGAVSGGLYLNMGITAVQLDSMGLAKYYFMKAQEFEATYEEAATALEYVDSQFSRQSAMLPKLPWDRAVDWIIEVPQTSGLFLLGFFITLSGLVMVYLKWFNKLNFSKLPAVVATLLVTGSAIALLSFYADYVDQRYDEAVFTHSSSRVYESPDPETALVSIAYEGYELTIDQFLSEERENWYYIRLGNGQYGWIPQEGVKVL